MFQIVGMVICAYCSLRSLELAAGEKGHPAVRVAAALVAVVSLAAVGLVWREGADAAAAMRAAALVLPPR